MRPSDMSASQRPTLLLTLLLTLTLPVWADPATRALRERERWNDLNQQSRANTQAVENQMRSQSLQLIEQAISSAWRRSTPTSPNCSRPSTATTPSRMQSAGRPMPHRRNSDAWPAAPRCSA